jgi:Holliday junction resolvase RusA-like endonuclease
MENNNNKKSFHFDYLLEPKSCPRPRVTKTSHSYMPKDYVEWKRQFIQETALLLAEYKDFKTIDYPVTVGITFVFPRPQRMKHHEIPSQRLFHASKPDVDNCIKAVLDGLVDAQCLQDDHFVVSVTGTKYYCSKIDETDYEYSHISVSIYEC